MLMEISEDVTFFSLSILHFMASQVEIGILLYNAVPQKRRGEG